MFSMIAAVGWDPWFRGVLTIIIAVGTLCGSVYLILGTNLGARLGFLIALAALAGWMFIMGAIWWTYGKGLLGEAASWQPVDQATILQTTKALSDAGVLDDIDGLDGDSASATAANIEARLVTDGWESLNSAGASYQQAQSAAAVLVEESGAFEAGEFVPVAVYDIGGERRFTLADGALDFWSFWHKDHFALVEIAPVIEQRTEPGRAPVRPQIDESKPHQYVYMIRDLGSLRRPAAIITLSSLLILLVLCYMLHERDRVVRDNLNRKALPPAAG
jgi:hypothetical protein